MTRLPVAVGERFSVTDATTPLASAVEFIPVSKQMLFAHDRDLLAATAAGPAVVVYEATSPLGAFNVHCKPAELPG